MSDIIPIVTIVTPTTGKSTLFNLIETITRQKVPVVHMLLWDDKRVDSFVEGGNMSPEKLDKKEYWDMHQYRVNNIILKGSMVNGIASGSSLRAVGLMAANTEYVTFADDDVMWEDGHLASMLQTISEKNSNWAFCKRKIWSRLPDNNGPQFELIGIDEFESVGEEAKTPYKMVDNNCMIFKRKFGVSAACLYRNTENYDDDRLFYQFLIEYAGVPAKTGLATINQICPDKLIQFFRNGCTPIPAKV